MMMTILNQCACDFNLVTPTGSDEFRGPAINIFSFLKVRVSYQSFPFC